MDTFPPFFGGGILFLYVHNRFYEKKKYLFLSALDQASLHIFTCLILVFVIVKCTRTIMSYANAAGNGNSKYYNTKMVTCWSKEVALEDLVEALYNKRILERLTALQKVKYGKMFGLASEDSKVLEDLILRGIDVNGLHLEFTYHKGQQLTVYVTNIPFGIAHMDMHKVFSGFGTNFGAKPIKKKFRGFELYTGDWILTYDRLVQPIPSYVGVRGWWAYVKYAGQEATCRKCNKGGHVFANCPQRTQEEPGNKDTSKDKKEERPSEPENMDVHEPPPPNEPGPTQEEIISTPSMQEEFPEMHKPSEEETASEGAFQEILENLKVVPEEDQRCVETPENQSQAWADSRDESCDDGSEKPQEKSKERNKVKSKVGPSVYCSYCRVDSHTEEQCGKVAFTRQTAKRKLGRKDSKPSRDESLGKKRKSIHRFKADLESIVMRGSNTSDVQYIVESECPEELYALWLVSRYGHRLTALSARNLAINRNAKVMDFWSKFSSENLNRFAAEELLMEAYERVQESC